jgi:hypothetical protein
MYVQLAYPTGTIVWTKARREFWFWIQNAETETTHQFQSGLMAVGRRE